MKKFFNKSKVRIAIACAVAIAFFVLSVVSFVSGGMAGWQFALAILLSVLAGLFIVIRIPFNRPASIIVFLLLPFLALCCMEFYTHVPWDLSAPITLLNYLFYLLLFLVFSAIFGTSRWGSVAAPVIPMLFGLANYFVVSFRSSPIVPWDFYSIGTAVSIADNYTFTITPRIVFVLMGFAFLMILGEKTALKLGKWKVRLASGAVAVLLLFGYVQAVQTKFVEEVFGLDNILFTPNVLYRNNGFAGAFLANLQYMQIEKPKGYSEENVEEIASNVRAGAEDKKETENQKETADGNEKKPNIIVIMNEAFSDLSVYGDFNVSEDYMPFIHSLQKDTVKGNIYVSVKGGNTANTEFEFLTGNTMAFLPNGSVAYQQYLKSEMPSLASHLKSLGYQTAALHPYYASGWNRNTVYPDLGFDETYFIKDFTEATTLRGYIDDRSAFEKIVELYEEKEGDEPLFAFEVTMQNHGGYSKEAEDFKEDVLLSDLDPDEKSLSQISAERYLSLIKRSDEAFRELTEYFESVEEPTIIVMFGDHQPSDYISNVILRLLGKDTDAREDSVDEFSEGYIVPFVMWANYSIEEERVDAVSVNYLSSLLLEKAGLPLTDFQSFLNKMREEVPVLTANFWAGREESGELSFHNWKEGEASAEEEDLISQYKILQYNDLNDVKNRLAGFFGGTSHS